MADVTQALMQLESGDPKAADQLLILLYDELRKLAAARMALEPAGHTLQPTALVHEAYVRLVGSSDRQVWASRGHFFAAAAEAMRRVLIDAARKRNATKRGGGRQQSLGLNDVAEEQSDVDLLALDEALGKLELTNPTVAKLVKLRYFCGLSIPEVAAHLEVSPRTASSYWAYAKAYLLRELSPNR